jgi:hypothetical protein
MYSLALIQKNTSILINFVNVRDTNVIFMANTHSFKRELEICMSLYANILNKARETEYVMSQSCILFSPNLIRVKFWEKN